MKEMVFNCYLDGDLFMKGTAKQIAVELDIPCSSTVNTYAIKKARYHKRYTFKFTGDKIDLVEEEEKRRPKPPTKHEKDLEWITWSLNQSPYYMTSYHNRADEFKEELKERGIEFVTEKCPFKRGHYYLKRVF